MSAQEDADRIIAVLEQSKLKLAEAQKHLLAAATRVSTISRRMGHVLGRNGQSNPALAQLRVAEKNLVDKAMGVKALIMRVDTAIGQTRAAAGGGGAGGGGSAPAPSG